MGSRGRSWFPPQDLRSSNDEVTYISSNCMPCSLFTTRHEDAFLFLFHYTLPLCICCSRDWEIAELIPSHTLLCLFTHLLKKTRYFFSPKYVPKDLKRQLQSIKVKPGRSTYYVHNPSCIFFKTFNWIYNINVLRFFPFILDSMCVKMWEPECGITYCCYLVKPQSWNDKKSKPHNNK